MKTFEERKAEVMRRSRARIKARRRIVSCTAALGVCAIGATLAMWPWTPAENFYTYAGSDGTIGDVETDISVESTAEDVGGTQNGATTGLIECTVDDRITAYIGDGYERVKQALDDALSTATVKDTDAIDTSTARPVITAHIRVRDEHGRTTTYLLYWNFLDDLQSHIVYHLTDDALATLEAALGIQKEDNR